jgi:2,4-dienoyl-CoA reductase-like NADH-dependent reductase (Old Yellow Enzyme family)
MDALFTPAEIGTLRLPNRFVRSATAERMADDTGQPRASLEALYRELVRGGVGLIITGHMYVHPGGKAHPEMTGIYSDDLIDALSRLAAAVHEEGGRVVAQINHGGMQSSRETVDDAVAPSAVNEPYSRRPARQMSQIEIEETIEAYGQAARRAKEAGIDGVQIHGAHGYLISQFLSPLVNHRTDEWGGDPSRRMTFLRSVAQAIRQQVGDSYPVLIKLGMVDGMQEGLSSEAALAVVAELDDMGIDALEISSGVTGTGGSRAGAIRTVRNASDEAYFRPIAKAARQTTKLPILLVGGLRSRSVMDDVLDSGDADLISICRPLICEPALPNRFREGVQHRSGCISGNQCWAKGPNEGIGCKCPKDEIDKTRA